jgi:hypothetical protein
MRADEGQMDKLIGCLVAKVGAGASRASRVAQNDSGSGRVIRAGNRMRACEEAGENAVGAIAGAVPGLGQYV